MIALFAGVVMAQDLVTYEARAVVPHGERAPAIDFHPQVDGTFGFTLDCGVRRWSLPAAPHPAGSTVSLTLSGVPKGVHSCAGSIDVDTSEGSGTLTFTLPVVSLGPLDWTASLDDVDLSARTARARTSRPLQRAEAVIIGADGQPLATVPGDLSDPRQPSFTWLPSDEVLQIAITATDVHGFVSTLKLSPWSYAIPHEDVVFATGQATVSPVEAKKLEATWADIQAVLDRYGSIVDIELFVVGYTDTVGTASANLTLSQRRARSIAKWFKGRGFPGAVHSQGFGESVLAVGTDDEVDEARNRRVLYLLAASAPGVSEAIPRADWRKE